MLKLDANGLIVAIAQDELSGAVRMVAWMNEAALQKTIDTGKATFFSRSRQALWTKGETSGNFLSVRSIHLDCDADTLLLRVRASGPSCHTGQPTCFFTEYPAKSEVPEAPPPTYLHELERELAQRASEATGQKSYTKYLLERGAGKISEKVTEEASEYCAALQSESDERVVSETADLLYHVMVGLRQRNVSLDDVISALAARAGRSGHAEKASRTGEGTA